MLFNDVHTSLEILITDKRATVHAEKRFFTGLVKPVSAWFKGDSSEPITGCTGNQAPAAILCFQFTVRNFALSPSPYQTVQLSALPPSPQLATPTNPTHGGHLTVKHADQETRCLLSLEIPASNQYAWLIIPGPTSAKVPAIQHADSSPNSYC